MREINITLPTLHTGQVAILTKYVNVLGNAIRNRVVRCGRRWGKTKMMVTVAADRAIKGGKVGLFTPANRQLDEPWDELVEILGNLVKTKNRGKGRIRLWTGGLIDFWSLDDNPLAGRGREYDDVLIDEAAFTKNAQMMDIWKKSIKPTMLTRRGRAWVFSTPNGEDPENFFWRCCNDPEMEFEEFHAPTDTNPYVPLDEFEKERASNDPRVFSQEFLAEFVAWNGDALIDITKMMGDDGLPVPYPTKCDAVVAIIDSAAKDGSGNDGTAVIYCAINKITGIPLTVLDWDIIKIEGGILIDWLPNVYARLDELALECHARVGSLGTFIEDAGPSGIILNQQAQNAGYRSTPIDSKLTSMGKDPRGLSVSKYFYQGMVKMSAYAYDKEVLYNRKRQNHLVTQIKGFYIGDKNAHKRADDLYDCLTYSAAIVLGDSSGF